MPVTKAKPQTPKADAATDADHRKAYRQFDDDAQRFGKRVADYNAGFTRGWADGKKKGMRYARSARKSKGR